MAYAKKTTISMARSWLIAPALFGALFFALTTTFGLVSAIDAYRAGRALSPGGGVALVMALALSIVPVLVARLGRTMPQRTGRVETDVLGLTVDGERVLRRGQVRHTRVLETDHGLVVRLFRRLGELNAVDVAVETNDEADALLQAMRLDRAQWVSKHVLNTWTVGRYSRNFVVSAVPFLGWFAVLFLWGPFRLSLHHIHLTGTVPLATLLPLVYLALVGTTIVDVGADGIHVRRLLGRGEFVPFSAIASATRTARDITIALRDGRTLTMNSAMTGTRHASDRDEGGNRLVERIQAAIADRNKEAANPAIVTRSDQTTAAWVRSALAVSDEASSFRRPAVPPDVLWRIVEDPSAVPTARVGAAVALRSRLDDDGRSRLRIAADACAAKPLRAALDAVAADCSEDELIAQLEPVVDHPMPPRKLHVEPSSESRA